MLLSRLYGWFKQHQTTNIFLLEILAVFIGISASLVVDDWRVERAAIQELDRQLRELHFDRLRLTSNVQTDIDANQLGLESALVLGLGDTENLAAAELLDHVHRACFVSPRLARDDIAMPRVDRADVQLLISTVEDMVNNVAEYYSTSRNQAINEIADLCGRIGQATDIVIDTGMTNWTFVAERASDERDQTLAILGSTSVSDVASQHNLSRAFRIHDEDVRALFRQTIQARQAATQFSISLMDNALGTVTLIEEHVPDIGIRFDVVGIDGTATGFGFQNFVPMARNKDDPDIWFIEHDFVDGVLKFRADDAWLVNWGVAQVDGATIGVDFAYVGDPNLVFPTGKAELEGANIPVRGGRYRLSFNTRTLEYRFDEL